MSFLLVAANQLFGGNPKKNIPIQQIGGGCIHHAGVFEFEGRKYFMKWNNDSSEMFKTEAKGLMLLQESLTVDVPHVIGYGRAESTDYLCLEYVETKPTRIGFWTSFGQSMAELHKTTAAKFGLDHDNYIGSLRQYNSSNANWTAFFTQQRLVPQIELAGKNGLITEEINQRFEMLFSKLGDLIPTEKPSLLHGDLWSGNFLVGKFGQPVVFDPAVYFGHREAELAFTKLFGGFDNEFYQAYHNVFPLQPDHEERVEIFNLYPLLVHLNLFGSSYLSGIIQTLRRFT